MFAPVLSVPLGYQQITDSDIATAVGLTVPDGATFAILEAEAQSIRWRDDGTDPTADVGMLLVVNVPFVYSGTLSAFTAIETTSGGILNVSYYR